MRVLGRWTLAVVFALLLTDGSRSKAGAVAVGDRAPCDKNLTETSGACSVHAQSKSDEERVADWLVERILDVDLTGDPVVDYSAAEIAAATGVDATKLNLDRIRERVQKRLRDASRWGEVRLRVEDVDESRAADDDPVTTQARPKSQRAGAGAVPSASTRSSMPASPSRTTR